MSGSSLFYFWKNPKFRPVRGLITLVMGLSFLVPSVSWAFETQTYSPNNPEAALAERLSIPSSMGKVVERQTGRSQENLILIQDLHCNYEVQSNIRRILATITRQYPQIRLVSGEGATGIIPTEEFTALPDTEQKKKVTEYFLEQGKLTGADALGITAGSKLELYGAEDPDLYARSLSIAQNILSEENQGMLMDLQEQVRFLSTRIYGKALLAFEQRRQDALQGKLDADLYHGQLVAEAKRAGIETSADRADREFYGRVSDFQDRVVEDAYLEQALRARLVKTTNEKSLFAVQRTLELAEHVLSVSASQEEIKELRALHQDMPMTRLAQILQTALEKANFFNAGAGYTVEELGYLEKAVQEGIRFYELAEARNHSLYDRTVRRAAKRGEKSYVLITGGFHTEAIKQAAMAAGSSVVVIRPRQDKQDASDTYYQLLMNPEQPTPLETAVAQAASKTAALAQMRMLAGSWSASFKSMLTRVNRVVTQTLGLSVNDALAWMGKPAVQIAGLTILGVLIFGLVAGTVGAGGGAVTFFGLAVSLPLVLIGSAVLGITILAGWFMEKLFRKAEATTITRYLRRVAILLPVLIGVLFMGPMVGDAAGAVTTSLAGNEMSVTTTKGLVGLLGNVPLIGQMTLYVHSFTKEYLALPFFLMGIILPVSGVRVPDFIKPANLKTVTQRFMIPEDELAVRAALAKKRKNGKSEETSEVPKDSNYLILPSQAAAMMGYFSVMGLSVFANNISRSEDIVPYELTDNPYTTAPSPIRMAFLNFEERGDKIGIIPILRLLHPKFNKPVSLEGKGSKNILPKKYLADLANAFDPHMLWKIEYDQDSQDAQGQKFPALKKIMPILGKYQNAFQNMFDAAQPQVNSKSWAERLEQINRVPWREGEEQGFQADMVRLVLFGVLHEGLHATAFFTPGYPVFKAPLDSPLWENEAKRLGIDIQELKRMQSFSVPAIIQLYLNDPRLFNSASSCRAAVGAMRITQRMKEKYPNFPPQHLEELFINLWALELSNDRLALYIENSVLQMEIIKESGMIQDGEERVFVNRLFEDAYENGTLKKLIDSRLRNDINGPERAQTIERIAKRFEASEKHHLFIQDFNDPAISTAERRLYRPLIDYYRHFDSSDLLNIAKEQFDKSGFSQVTRYGHASEVGISRLQQVLSADNNPLASLAAFVFQRILLEQEEPVIETIEGPGYRTESDGTIEPTNLETAENAPTHPESAPASESALFVDLTPDQFSASPDFTFADGLDESLEAVRAVETEAKADSEDIKEMAFTIAGREAGIPTRTTSVLPSNESMGERTNHDQGQMIKTSDTLSGEGSLNNVSPAPAPDPTAAKNGIGFFYQPIPQLAGVANPTQAMQQSMPPSVAKADAALQAGQLAPLVIANLAQEPGAPGQFVTNNKALAEAMAAQINAGGQYTAKDPQPTENVSPELREAAQLGDAGQNTLWAVDIAPTAGTREGATVVFMVALQMPNETYAVEVAEGRQVPLFGFVLRQQTSAAGDQAYLGRIGYEQVFSTAVLTGDNQNYRPAPKMIWVDADSKQLPQILQGNYAYFLQQILKHQGILDALQQGQVAETITRLATGQVSTTELTGILLALQVQIDQILNSLLARGDIEGTVALRAALEKVAHVASVQVLSSDPKALKIMKDGELVTVRGAGTRRAFHARGSQMAVNLNQAAGQLGKSALVMKVGSTAGGRLGVAALSSSAAVGKATAAAGRGVSGWSFAGAVRSLSAAMRGESAVRPGAPSALAGLLTGQTSDQKAMEGLTEDGVERLESLNELGAEVPVAVIRSGNLAQLPVWQRMAGQLGSGLSSSLPRRSTAIQGLGGDRLEEAAVRRGLSWNGKSIAWLALAASAVTLTLRGFVSTGRFASRRKGGPGLTRLAMAAPALTVSFVKALQIMRSILNGRLGRDDRHRMPAWLVQLLSKLKKLDNRVSMPWDDPAEVKRVSFREKLAKSLQSLGQLLNDPTPTRISAMVGEIAELRNLIATEERVDVDTEDQARLNNLAIRFEELVKQNTETRLNEELNQLNLNLKDILRRLNPKVNIIKELQKEFDAHMLTNGRLEEYQIKDATVPDDLKTILPMLLWVKYILLKRLPFLKTIIPDLDAKLADLHPELLMLVYAYRVFISGSAAAFPKGYIQVELEGMTDLDEGFRKNLTATEVTQENIGQLRSELELAETQGNAARIQALGTELRNAEFSFAFQRALNQLNRKPAPMHYRRLLRALTKELRRTDVSANYVRGVLDVMGLITPQSQDTLQIETLNGDTFKSMVMTVRLPSLLMDDPILLTLFINALEGRKDPMQLFDEDGKAVPLPTRNQMISALQAA